MRFHEIAHAKLHFDDFRGVSVMSGVPRLRKRFLASWEKFDTTQAEDNLLFKIYIQILNIVYSKLPGIIGQCDEHILTLKSKQYALPEMDNDTLIQDYV